MEVRAKKALGQHFLTDQKVARAIVDSLLPLDSIVESKDSPAAAGRPYPGLCTSKVVEGEKAAGGSGESHSPVLEVGPGMGVLTQYLLEREDIDLKLVEIDTESVEYLLTHFQGMQGRLMEADFLTLKLERIFPERFAIIGNFPYNISSQIFFKVLDYKDRIPEVVGMVQKEVAERLAEGPGSKTYGILSVLLQAWYDIEYLFTVGSGCFAPPPKVESAVIRLTRNGRTSLGCDENLFKTVVKTAFGQRRKMMRNPLKPLARAKADRLGWSEDELSAFLSREVFSLRPERLSVEDFIDLTNLLAI
jgi:16S rRNA (adenine1518-N6/adenine1519-N6)-dimethyltransferase